MPASEKSLISYIKTALDGPVQPQAEWLAKKLAGEFNGEVLAVLYYGSCLRTGKLEGLILDFYLIVGNYRKAYASGGLSLANRVLPPNVFYREAKDGRVTLRAKVAVLSLEDFLYRTSEACLNVSVWARFSQPSRLIFCRDNKTRAAILDGVTGAHLTMLSAAMPLLGAVKTPKEIWPFALGLTYGAELRSEKKGKGEELYIVNKPYFDAVTPLVLTALGGHAQASAQANKWRWSKRRLNGKTVSLMRLIKATFTFSGGIDYLAWKIGRSSGITVTLKPWQRRHPLIAGFFLFLQLRLKGAFR